VSRPAWFVLLALLATGSGFRPAGAQETGDPEVVEISFRGNEAIPSSALEHAILTEATTCRAFLFYFPLPLCPLTDLGFAHRRQYLDEEELPLDRLRLQLYYRQRGYRQAEVGHEVVREDGRARIAFTIVEHEPTIIRSLEITGADSLLPPERQLELLAVREGSPLDLAAFALGEGRLIEELRDRGYVNATVLRDYFIPRDTREAEMNLRVVPGPRVRIGEVRVEGSGEIGDGIIHSVLAFESGDVFRDREIIESQRRLYNLEALRFASITSERRTDTDTLIDLRVRVAPAPRRTVDLGVGMETDECAQVQADWTNRNFLGRARVLRLTTRLSNLFASQLQGRFPCTDVSDDPVYQELNYRLAAAFEQPVFTGGRNSLRAGLYTEEETVPDLFVRTSTGGELAFTHQFSSRMALTAAIRPELTSFGEQSADIYFCVNFGFCTPEDIGVLSERRWLSPVALLWALDRTDSRLSATRGYYVSTEAEYAGAITGSDYRYVRTTIDAAAFRSLSDSRVLAGHVRFGVIEPAETQAFATTEGSAAIVHPRKRFFAGGAESIRGFAANLLGPTVLVVDVEDDCPGQDLETCVDDLPPGAFAERPAGGNAVIEASLEVRNGLGDRWSVVAFVDAGQVWRGLGDRSAVILTPGVGFRFRSPIGPLRVDFGYDPSSASDRPVVALQEGGDIQELNRTVRFDPYGFDDPGVATEFLRRMQLQFSIGEAF
jgi:outer membrane protein assembly factor BamA